MDKRVGSCEAWQWASSKFTSVVCRTYHLNLLCNFLCFFFFFADGEETESDECASGANTEDSGEEGDNVVISKLVSFLSVLIFLYKIAISRRTKSYWKNSFQLALYTLLLTVQPFFGLASFFPYYNLLDTCYYLPLNLPFVWRVFFLSTTFLLF